MKARLVEEGEAAGGRRGESTAGERNRETDRERCGQYSQVCVVVSMCIMYTCLYGPLDMTWSKKNLIVATI